MGAPGTRSADGLDLPDTVRRAALAIETFHKASLVHDDIEDDDTFRYGRETLHRQHGVATAINVGDYLIGLGYRLVSRDRQTMGADVAADILDRLADAHLRLSEGQGAELLWRDAADQTITPIEALKLYALKTAPAFEAALYAGVRLAGPADAYAKMIHEFSKNLGIAFQILNDLKDWTGDAENKMVTGADASAGRPTLLLALALEGASPAERTLLLPGRGTTTDPDRVERIRMIYTRRKVFEKAEAMIAKFRARCESLADEVQPDEFRALLYYLVDTVLDRTPSEQPEAATGFTLPLVAASAS
jgi:geranylgeranyl pyrophosphate synthase